MPKRALGLLVGLLLGLLTVPLFGQGPGSLSAQVLRLLVRNNYWTGVQTFGSLAGATAKVERTALVASNCTDSFENRSGALYFNCGLLAAAAPGLGTVSSVGLTVPSILAVSGSPITTSGTFAVTLSQQNANSVLSGSATPGSSVPTFRSLVDADVPDTITISGTNNVSWGSINKAGSSLGDLATTSATDLLSGTLPDARFPATLPALSGVNLTALNATNLGSGAVPAARMPALTGDVTSTVGTIATTLASTAVTAGSYTLASITVDAKGRLTAASSGTAGAGTVTATTGTLTASAVMVGNGTTDLKALASLGTTTTVLHGNAAGVPSFAAVALAADVSGTLPVANGGTGITSAASNGSLLIGSGTGYAAATLTGTADQLVVTNGPNTITLSTPQAINTTSTPQFARIGLGAAAGASAQLTIAGQTDWGFIDDGNSGASDTVNWATGEIHKSTLTANTTYTFSGPISGRTYILHVIQDATGSRTVTWPGTVVWQGGSAPTLTTGATKTDVCFFRWNGTSYLANCELNF